MKLNKKKKIIVFSCIILCVVLFISGFCFYQSAKQKKLEQEKVLSIQNHYSSSVIMEKGSIYFYQDGKYEVVGSVENTIYPFLGSMVIDDSNDIYFPILNSDYFVYYEDVFPITDYLLDALPDYYLTKETLMSKETTNFYHNDTLLFSLHQSLNIPISYAHDEYYRVSFLNDYYDIKKEEVESTLDENLEESTAISVIEFPELKDDCKSDNCITSDKLKEFLQKFKENELYSITKEDYERWIKQDVHLKKNAIFFVSEHSENLQSIFEEFGYIVNENGDWKYQKNNEVSKVSNSLDLIPSYFISQNTSEDHFNKMVKGEKIEKPKPVTTTVTPKALPSLNAKATNIAVLNYHFFYAPGEDCSGGNCMPVAQFREQLDYLKQNQYKTLTMEEYRAWMYGEIELPARSVLITVDDGAKGTGRHNGNKLIPLLEEYDMHATLFLISGWWAKSNYESSHLDIESHTYDMHTEGLCSSQTRGAKMLCSTKEQVMEDLKKSIQMTGSNTAFCFPFYAYNDSAIQSIKESGFKLAFVGGSVKSNRSNDKYKIPRYPIYSTTTLNQFINYIA